MLGGALFFQKAKFSMLKKKKIAFYVKSDCASAALLGAAGGDLPVGIWGIYWGEKAGRDW